MKRRRAPTRVSAETPQDLRSTELVLGGERFVVLSFASPPKPRLPGLSRAESAVVRAASTGLTSAEIAAHRGSSVFTVQNQLASAYRKLGVSSRGELVALLASLDHDET